MIIILMLAILIVLLFCSALISGSEVAFFSVSKNQLREFEVSENKSFKLAAELLNSPDKLLATILITNNFVNIAIIVVSTFLCNNFFSNLYSPVLLFLIEIILVTFLILLFGEVIPKVYANKNKEVFITKIAIPLKFLQKVFLLFIRMLLFFTNVIECKLSRKKVSISTDEVSRALEVTSVDGAAKNEQKIFEDIISFGNTDVKQVMKPRVDVVSLDIQTKFNMVLETILKSGYSRIPVCDNSMDNIKGILYIKDILPHLNKKNYQWQQLLRDTFFVHETKKADMLLQDFKNKKIHLAVVVDEHGGTSGIVTMEDIIEEIVGEINDEFDDDDMNYSKLDNDTYLFDGKMLLVDFYKILNLTASQEYLFEKNKYESDTLGGFILEFTGDFPVVYQKITFQNYVFEIEAIDRKRIKRLKVFIKR